MSNLLSLPQELTEEIATYLSASETSKVQLTCHSMNHQMVRSMHKHAVSTVAGKHPLHWAVVNRHSSLVSYLLNFFPVNLCLTEDKRTALHIAAMTNRGVRLMTLLISRGADVDAIEDHAQTPLILLARRTTASLPLMNLLIQSGANVNAVDTTHNTALTHCIETERDDLCVILLAAGANPDQLLGDPQTMTTPLHIAAGEDRTHLITALLSAGADINKADSSGLTPLHLSACTGSYDGSSMLVAAGAALNRIDRRGETPLHLAIGACHEEVALMLIEAGANGEGRDIFGMTPLLLACEAVLVDVVRALVEQEWGLHDEVMCAQVLTKVRETMAYGRRSWELGMGDVVLDAGVQEIWELITSDIEKRGGKVDRGG